MSKPEHHVATVLLVDDHPLMRKGLRTLLASETDLTVIGEAGDGDVPLEPRALALGAEPAHGLLDHGGEIVDTAHRRDQGPFAQEIERSHPYVKAIVQLRQIADAERGPYEAEMREAGYGMFFREQTRRGTPS